MATLYTIGYANVPRDTLIAALQEAGVTTLIDVRELPSSRKAGFSKTGLAAALSAAGIGYLHLRPLGTPKAGRVANKQKRWSEFWDIVDTQLATPEARLALTRAAAIAAAGPTALLCLEADHATCHRSRVADALVALGGFEVEHLHPEPPLLFG
ncbi:MAG: DUF488 domain-containing protein [Myxococcota bacterium]